MKTSPSAESGRRADRLLPRRGESPFCRPLLRGFSPQWTFPMGQRQPRHGAVVRGQTQKFLTLAAKSFVAGTSLPWTAETCCGRFSASDRSGSPKPRQRVRRRLAGAPAAACRSRA
ncbi:hypothetical protein [Shigella sonnei]|uniref:hypothetical protein n=1 Tax=Shigella sonnei TaxID=624 RepID=UPI002090F256|nr:hypothetical protein [Shigella sonnei]